MTDVSLRRGAGRWCGWRGTSRAIRTPELKSRGGEEASETQRGGCLRWVLNSHRDLPYRNAKGSQVREPGINAQLPSHATLPSPADAPPRWPHPIGNLTAGACCCLLAQSRMKDDGMVGGGGKEGRRHHQHRRWILHMWFRRNWLPLW